jgi:hypothetical membrane protein
VRHPPAWWDRVLALHERDGHSLTTRNIELTALQGKPQSNPSIAQVNRRLIGAGLIGPLLFLLVALVDGFTKPDYSAIQNDISELALGAHGWVQSANFLLFGVLLIAFAAGLRQLFPTGRASVFGPLLLALSGLGLVVSGVFPTDPISATSNTLAGTIHNLAGLVVFSMLSAACFVYARRFRREPAWRGYGLYSVMTGVLSPVLVVAFVVQFVDTPYAGLFQRVFIAILWLWIAVVALHARTVTMRAQLQTVAE